jgi:hypothetical protein
MGSTVMTMTTTTICCERVSVGAFVWARLCGRGCVSAFGEGVRVRNPGKNHEHFTT